MTTNKQKITRIKNEINKKKLARKEERQKKIDRHWHLLSKLKIMGNSCHLVTHGHP